MTIKKVSNIFIDLNNIYSNEDKFNSDKDDLSIIKFKKTAILMNELFSDFKFYFPAYKNILKTQKDIDDCKIIWAWALSAENITTKKQIDRGRYKASQSESPFLPTPAIFIKWCRGSPQDNGLPSVDEAYSEACKKVYYADKSNNWTHCIVLMAAKDVGMWKLQNSPHEITRKLFEDAYLCLFKRYMNGEKFNYKSLIIKSEKQKPRPISRKKGNDFISNIKNNLKV